MAISTINQNGLNAPLTLTAPVLSGNVTATTITSPAATALTLQSAGTTAVTVDTSQNVGVGTTSQGSKLEVKASGASVAQLQLTQYNSTDGWKINADDNAGPLRFIRQGSSLNGEAMRIANNGTVMIGTSTATAGLLAVYANNAISIDGPTNGPYIEIRKTGTVIGYVGSGAAINSGNIGIYSTTGAVNVQSGGSGGVNLNSGATSWSSASDARLKDVTGPYSNALNDIAQLEPVKFTWKDDADKKSQVGILAQSIEAVVPEAIDTFTQKDDETEYLAVRYTELIPLLTAAIQELKAEFDAYKASHP